MRAYSLVGLLAVGALLGCRQNAPPQTRMLAADPEEGKRLIVRYGCGACHWIPGVRTARGLVGPPLDAFGQRGYIAGREPNSPDALVAWIVNPKQTDPETAMPILGVTAPEAQHIAAYLYTLKRGGLGPPHLLDREWLRRIAPGRGGK